MVQADLLSISRSSLYYQPSQPSADEVALKHRIDAIYTQYPFYGSRRITAQLRREGQEVNRKAVQRHMREMGIVGIHPRPNLRRRAQSEQVYPYLLRGVRCAYPNQVWGIDVTYIPLQTGWMYLVAVLDWYSRYVVSWELDDTLQAPFVLAAAPGARAKAVPGCAPPWWKPHGPPHAPKAPIWRHSIGGWPRAEEPNGRRSRWRTAS
jgi:putative transposase